MSPTATPYPVPEESDDPKFRQFFDYWVAHSKDGFPPRKRDFDPLEVIDILGHLNVARVHRDGGAMRFQFILWGTKIAELYGGDFTGKFMEDVMLPTALANVQAAFEQVARDAVPHFWQVPVPRPGRDYIGYRRLALPFADDDRRKITHIIALMVPDRPTRPTAG